MKMKINPTVVRDTMKKPEEWLSSGAIDAETIRAIQADALEYAAKVAQDVLLNQAHILRCGGRYES